MSDIAIRINNVVKEYDVYARPIDVALEVLTRRARHQKFRALGGVSFEVARGEVLGIIGPNGAGKSTLLKIITGVLDATAGSVDVAGRVTAILELGLGFNPEYSGRENIYLSGLLYGMDRAEVSRKIDAIIAFSGLGEFIERPVKTYSSGMHSRLAFSIATAVDPDILIIDEALAAGDAGFVQKCLRRIRQLCSGGRTVLLVSHGTGLLAQLCSRVVWLEGGRVRMIGPTLQVVQTYDLAAHQSADALSWVETVEDSFEPAGGEQPTAETTAAAQFPTAPLNTNLASVDLPNGVAQTEIVVDVLGADRQIDCKAPVASSNDTGRQIFRRGPIFIENVELYNARMERTSRLVLCQPATLKVNYRVEGQLPAASLGIAIAINNRGDLAPVAQFYTQNIRPTEDRDSYAAAPERRKPGRRGQLILHFDKVLFRKGDYLLSIGLLPNEPGTWEFYEYRHFYYPFCVDDAGMDVGAPVFLDLAMVHKPLEIAGDASTRPVSDDAPRQSAPAVAAGEPVLAGPLANAQPVGEPITLRAEIESICLGVGGYPKQWPRHTACPACGEGPLRPAFLKYGFTHAKCGVCDLVCVDPYPPDGILAKLYDGTYYTRVRELFEGPRLLKQGLATPFTAPEETLRRIVARATAGRQLGSWLDVGGGIGAFVGLVADMKPTWTVHLNEMNRTSINIARTYARGRFEIVDSEVSALLAAGVRYDVISSVCVLEHIPDPLPFLEAYASLLKPGGMLVTVVPHFTPLNAAVSKGSSPNVVPPFHVSLFNEPAMRRLMARVSGLALVEIEQTGDVAYRLIDHVSFGDHWDITIPTVADPEPRSIMIANYDDESAQTLNALAEVDKVVGEFFAKRDGRLYLTAYCQSLAR